MFSSVTRALTFLARTPLVLPPAGPAAVELTTLSTSAAAAGPSRSARPRAASRAFSSVSTRSAYAGMPMQVRGYASDKGKKELYSDEAGSTGAGTDDVAHTSAAFDKNPNPEQSAHKVEQESGKDFTNRSAANPANSAPVGEQGGEGSTNPLQTSRNKKE